MTRICQLEEQFADYQSGINSAWPRESEILSGIARKSTNPREM